MPGWCRCCLAEDIEMSNVFGTLLEFESQICDMLSHYGGILISEQDFLSKDICQTCLNNLTIAARFRDQCQKTEEFLKNNKFGLVEKPLKETSPNLDPDSEFTRSPSPSAIQIKTEIVDTECEDQYSQCLEEVSTEEPTEPPNEQPTAELAEESMPSENSEPDVGFFKRHQYFKCDECGKLFMQIDNFERHVLSHKSRPHKCGLCGKKYFQTGHFLRHVKNHKGPVRRYKCEVCGKEFIENGHLARHMRIHTGVRPYSCSACGKEFVQSGNMKRHMLTHDQVKQHFKCGECDKEFIRLKHFQRHKLVHAGLKPHKCDICDKEFVLPGKLEHHMLLHTRNVRPHQCHVCEKTFVSKVLFKKHLDRHGNAAKITNSMK
ncbi:zinc finger protein 16-like [Sabethes cyaneus]|uniref:zinc finger protein 16-like n=1 Tax=Sabethes cyaneus TaxID=53552 RepID=UPI00237DADA9|nr:zinc finger protein 16-like [Sabethes cyaneus]